LRRKGYPPIGMMMSGPQVVAVVNYIRTHFGNAYTDPVTVQDVSSARQTSSVLSRPGVLRQYPGNGPQ
jgi:mono/diheme cytochrome c family protein